MDTATITEADIDAARADYRQAEADLQRFADYIWVDGAATLDALLPVAQEHGVDEAVRGMLGGPDQLGPLRDHVTDSLYAESSDRFRDLLERLAASHERLDELTARREAVLRAKDPSRLQIVHIGGRPFEIDPSRGEVRSIDNPAERYRLPDNVRAMDIEPTKSKPSLTETLAKEAGIEPAKPGPPRDRTRSR